MWIPKREFYKRNNVFFCKVFKLSQYKQCRDLIFYSKSLQYRVGLNPLETSDTPVYAVEDLNVLNICMYYRGNISSWCSSNSEANASELLGILKTCLLLIIVIGSWLTDWLHRKCYKSSLPWSIGIKWDQKCSLV